MMRTSAFWWEDKRFIKARFAKRWPKQAQVSPVVCIWEMARGWSTFAERISSELSYWRAMCFSDLPLLVVGRGGFTPTSNQVRGILREPSTEHRSVCHKEKITSHHSLPWFPQPPYTYRVTEMYWPSHCCVATCVRQENPWIYLTSTFWHFRGVQRLMTDSHLHS